MSNDAAFQVVMLHMCRGDALSYQGAFPTIHGESVLTTITHEGSYMSLS